MVDDEPVLLEWVATALRRNGPHVAIAPSRALGPKEAITHPSFERACLMRALAAALVGISRKHLWEKLRRHQVAGAAAPDQPPRV